MWIITAIPRGYNDINGNEEKNQAPLLFKNEFFLNKIIRGIPEKIDEAYIRTVDFSFLYKEDHWRFPYYVRYSDEIKIITSIRLVIKWCECYCEK